jgi:hypothetical protein
MDENWLDWYNFRHIILTWYKEPYKTKKLEKKSISQIGLKSAYSLFPSSMRSSSGLRSRRRTYHTILKLADHALFKMVRYVLLRPLRP